MTRFVRFYVVGVAGFVLQVSTLVALDRIGVPAAPATALAVEAALLHNFFWHERWTWAGVASGSRPARLMRFHASNGIISIVGNVAMTNVLVHAGAPLVAANAAAVLTCALLNFGAAQVWVFCAKTWPIFHGHLQ